MNQRIEGNSVFDLIDATIDMPERIRKLFLKGLIESAKELLKKEKK